MEKPDYLTVIEKMIKSVAYGTVTVVIQDGKVIQIDKTEKVRLK